ncbi:hypothetical protein E2C01_009225 [Portunus trituberculatus]|uniref:Uncharacterized protein n=1 Tax=Portunus trituberculatus TaxID=210409 RepID=A0A5B7D4P8_PORTR|nr:hypothetical protein [Portunus trituberculatus]
MRLTHHPHPSDSTTPPMNDDAPGGDTSPLSCLACLTKDSWWMFTEVENWFSMQLFRETLREKMPESQAREATQPFIRHDPQDIWCPIMTF